jgi:hypothetical protein
MVIFNSKLLVYQRVNPQFILSNKLSPNHPDPVEKNLRFPITMAFFCGGKRAPKIQIELTFWFPGTISCRSMPNIFDVDPLENGDLQ